MPNEVKDNPPILCIAGPTAAGKSAAAMALAERLPLELIVMDSATIYRQMDIGTAKPSPQEQRQVPHHLLDILDPSERYSAADFCTDTLNLIPAIRQRGRIPLLVGGTMMYYNALRHGLHELPQADQALRERIEAEALSLGWPALHDRLKRVDPVTAQRLAPNDSQRIGRALEIYELTGRPMSALLAEQQRQVAPHRFITISLEPSQRQQLHDQIAKRFEQMMAAGFLNEVRQLHQRGDLSEYLPSIRCVGYRQLWGHLEGQVSYDEAIERGIAATCQLAKRQLTWLRRITDRVQIDCFAPDAISQVLNAAKAALEH